MEENASRAVFIGVSVFVAVITLSFIIKFYSTAKESASVANRYDVSSEYNGYLREILQKERINGLELRYLLNYYVNNENVQLNIYDQQILKAVKDSEDMEHRTLQTLNVNNNNYWLNNYQEIMEYNIRPNYNYGIIIYETNKGFNIIATFEG